MARKRSPTLTDGEARLMTVLWERSSATVADIVGALEPQGPVNYSTVQTLLRILEKKGYVAHHKVGSGVCLQPSDRPAAGAPSRAQPSADAAVQRVAQPARAEHPRARNDRARRAEAAEAAPRPGRVGGPWRPIVNWLWQGMALTAVSHTGAPSIAAPERHDPLSRLVADAGARAAAAAGRRGSSVWLEPAVAAVGRAHRSPRVPLPDLPAWPLTAAFVCWFGWVARIADARDDVGRRANRGAPPGDARSRPEREAALTHWAAVRAHGRPARLALCDRIPAAAVFGLGPAIIAVSPNICARLTDEELDQVILHEWAHVQRRDDFSRLGQIVVRIDRRPAPGGVVDRTTARDRARDGLRRLRGERDRRGAPPGPLPDQAGRGAAPADACRARPGRARLLAAGDPRAAPAGSRPQHVDRARPRRARTDRGRARRAGRQPVASGDRRRGIRRRLPSRSVPPTAAPAVAASAARADDGRPSACARVSRIRTDRRSVLVVRGRPAPKR